jgi:hypothetical protein
MSMKNILNYLITKIKNSIFKQHETVKRVFKEAHINNHNEGLFIECVAEIIETIQLLKDNKKYLDILINKLNDKIHEMDVDGQIGMISIIRCQGKPQEPICIYSVNWQSSCYNNDHELFYLSDNMKVLSRRAPLPSVFVYSGNFEVCSQPSYKINDFTYTLIKVKNAVHYYKVNEKIIYTKYDLYSVLQNIYTIYELLNNIDKLHIGDHLSIKSIIETKIFKRFLNLTKNYDPKSCKQQLQYG